MTATLGLGGNVGDPMSTMGAALRALHARSDCTVKDVSRLYRTPPWGNVDQDWFVNACALIETQLQPDDLLAVCLQIELDMKRERTLRWGPRTIDIDVLTYGDLEQRSEALELPHPRMTERGFVLMPLADIAHDLVVQGRSVRDWLAQADTSGIEPVSAARDWWTT